MTANNETIGGGVGQDKCDFKQLMRVGSGFPGSDKLDGKIINHYYINNGRYYYTEVSGERPFNKANYDISNDDNLNVYTNQLDEFVNYIENIKYVRCPFLIVKDFIDLDIQPSTSKITIDSAFNKSTFNKFVNDNFISIPTNPVIRVNSVYWKFDDKKIISTVTDDNAAAAAAAAGDAGKIAASGGDDASANAAADNTNIINLINLTYTSKKADKKLLPNVIAYFKTIFNTFTNTSNDDDKYKKIYKAAKYLEKLDKLNDTCWKLRTTEFDLTKLKNEYKDYNSITDNKQISYFPLGLYIAYYQSNTSFSGPGPNTFSTDIGKLITEILRYKLKNLECVDNMLELPSTTGGSKKVNSKKSSKGKRGGMAQINDAASPMTQYDLANGYSTLMNGGKKRKSKKGGMSEINEAASPITQYDLANGYSTLMNGGKKRKSKKGGMMELNPSDDPAVQSDLLNGLSTLTGGKKSKKEKKSKKGGMMELNPSADPAVQSDLLNGLSTLTGGRKSRKTKKGGADPPVNTSAILNMSNMVSMSDPYTMAQTRVAGEDAPSPFSSGMPNYASVEYGLPANMTNSLSGGLDQRVTGGAKKNKGKGKKGGNILEGVQTILRRLSSPKTAEVEVVKTEEKLDPNVGLVGGKKKAKKSKKSGGNIGEFTGAYDWQTQLALDAKSNMAGGKKNLKK